MNKITIAIFTGALMLSAGVAFGQSAPAGNAPPCPNDQPNCVQSGGSMKVEPGAGNAGQPAVKPDSSAQQPSAKPDSNTAQQPAPKPDTNTAQQPAAGGGASGNVTVNITPQQKTEVKQIIVAEKVQPVKVNFTIAIGTVVPRQTVVLKACSARLVELFPELRVRGCEYFYLDDGRIVFVEPATLKIILVVTV